MTTDPELAKPTLRIDVHPHISVNPIKTLRRNCRKDHADEAQETLVVESNALLPQHLIFLLLLPDLGGTNVLSLDLPKMVQLSPNRAIAVEHLLHGFP